MKPEETLDYHFRKVWHAISRMYNNEAAKYGLTMSVGFVLLNIDKNGTPSTQLGPKMGMEARSLTRTLKNLEKQGWIEKVPSENDRRVVLIRLTDSGRKARKHARDTVIRFNTYTQNNINTNDLNAFFRVCYTLSDLIDENNIFSNGQNND